MKILISYSGDLPITGYGGGHQVLRGFSRSLVRLGQQVRVIVGGRDEVGASSFDRGVFYRFNQFTASPFRFARTAHATIRSIREWRPDVVCCFCDEVAIVAPYCRLARIPVFVRLDAPELLDVSFTLAGLVRAKRDTGQLLIRLGCIMSSKVFVTSDYTYRQSIDIWNLSPKRVTTLGTGIDEAYLHSPLPGADYLHRERIRFLSVGRISLTQKPLDLVADALAQTRVPWSHWTIVGSGGPHDILLRDRLIALGIDNRVFMKGFMPPADIVHELARHDVVLLPSRYESFFLTVYEAIACHRFVITNDVAELRQNLLPSKLLILARDQSVSAYMDAIVEAWNRVRESGALRDESTDRVRRSYSWEAIGERFLEIADRSLSTH